MNDSSFVPKMSRLHTIKVRDYFPTVPRYGEAPIESRVLRARRRVQAEDALGVHGGVVQKLLQALSLKNLSSET